MWWPSGTWWSGRWQSRAGPVSALCSSPGSRQFLGVYFQNHRWPLVSKIWKPSKNHWKQWSGGWKSLNGDGWMTPKPLKNHRVQWSVSKKVVNGDGQRVAKPSKIQCQWLDANGSRWKKTSHPIAPKKWPLLTSTQSSKWATLLAYTNQLFEFCKGW